MSDCDDLDELLATRRLHGMNDNLFKDGNDTNVAIIDDNVKEIKETIQDLENECISLHELIDEEM